MTITATERWDGERLTRTERGWEAERRFDVTGTHRARAAQNAPSVPAYGSPHPENGVLKVTTKAARKRGPQYFIVSCRYSIQAISEDERDEDDSQNPLNQPAEIDVDYAVEREEFDRTPNGFAILNSARKPFDSNPTRDAGPIKLDITRNEPFYDAEKALRFRNLINTEAVRLEGRMLFGPLVGRIVSIEPARSFTFRDNFVPVRYSLILRGRLNVNGQPISGHHVRLMDRGYYVRVITPVQEGVSTLQLRDDEGEAIDEPHPLNGKGGKLGTKNGAGPPPGVLATERTEDAVWLWWRRYPEGSYRGLF